MNILYLSERDPRDIHFGGAQRTNYIWRALQQCGDVYSICFDQQYETEEIAPRIWHGKKLLRVNAWHYFWYRLERKLLEPFNVLPLWPMPTKLERSIEEIFPDVKFDLVVCRYCFDWAEMHLWNNSRIYVDFDDHPLEYYNTYKSVDVSSWLRPLGRWILKKQMKFIEGKVTGGWVSNPEQCTMIHCKEPIVGLKNIAVFPSSSYSYSSTRKDCLILVGSMSYYPNYSGADRFITEFWPYVSQKYPNLELLIIGKGLPDSYSRKWKKIPNVKELGYVEDLESYYQCCLASVVPIYSGGGTCIKSRESLAYGRVCLSSPFGVRGLEDCVQENNSALQIFETLEDFLSSLENVVFNESQRSVAEQEAVDYMKRTHSVESFMQTVKSTIMQN